MNRHWSSYVLLGCCLMLPLRQASAADPITESEADRLFSEGLNLMRADHCHEAIQRFAQSQRLDPSAATLINLADCYARIGKTATAWRTFSNAAVASAAVRDEMLHAKALEALAAMQKTLTLIRILASGPELELAVRVNGELVRDYREPFPVDPGETSIEVSAPGHESWKTKLQTKGQGEVFVVSIPSLAPVHNPPPAPEYRTNLRPAALVLGGIGFTGLTLGFVFGLRAKSAYDSANSQGACNSVYCNQRAHDLRDTAFERATVATWATILGAGAAAAGTVIWVTSPPRQEKTHMSLVPWLQPKQGVGGFIVEGQL